MIQQVVRVPLDVLRVVMDTAAQHHWDDDGRCRSCGKEFPCEVVRYANALAVQPSVESQYPMPFTMDSGEYFMRSDGAVFFYSHASRAWIRHSNFPQIGDAEPI